MNLKIIPLLSLFLFAAGCGDNSPFDEDYWQQPETEAGEVSVNDTRNFTATISPISTTLGDISGNVNISITQTDVESTTQLVEVPQSLMIGQRSITNSTCSDIAASFPPPEIVNDTSEFKNFAIEDDGSREALVAELNQDDPSNGDAVNLAGKSYVIKAYVQNLNTPIPESISLVPIACGVILEQARTSGGTTGTDGTVGGTTTGTTSGTAGGVIGGSIGGGIGGTTGI